MEVTTTVDAKAVDVLRRCRPRHPLAEFDDAEPVERPFFAVSSSLVIVSNGGGSKAAWARIWDLCPGWGGRRQVYG